MWPTRSDMIRSLPILPISGCDICDTHFVPLPASSLTPPVSSLFPTFAHFSHWQDRPKIFKRLITSRSSTFSLPSYLKSPYLFTHLPAIALTSWMTTCSFFILFTPVFQSQEQYPVHVKYL